MAKMTPEGAMGQASSTAIEYFHDIYDYLDGKFPKISAEVKMQCASQMTLAASIDFLSAGITGGIQYSDERGLQVHVTTSNDEDC